MRFYQRGISGRLRRVVVGISVLLACVGCAQRTSGTEVRDATSQENPQLSLAQGVAQQIGPNNPAIQRGARVVVGLEPCRSGLTCFSCFQCHGVRGEGGAAASLPRLAGQNARYLVSSLQRFASGERVSATMHEVAIALTQQQMSDVAAYFSAIPPPTLPAAAIQTGTTDTAAVALGQQISQQGLTDKGVAPCSTCHGVGRPAGTYYPELAGQFSDYLEQQLDQFREGRRRGADAAIMQTIARNLTAEQSHAVASYYSTLQPASAPVRE